MGYMVARGATSHVSKHLNHKEKLSSPIQTCSLLCPLQSALQLSFQRLRLSSVNVSTPLSVCAHSINQSSEAIFVSIRNVVLRGSPPAPIVQIGRISITDGPAIGLGHFLIHATASSIEGNSHIQ